MTTYDVLIVGAALRSLLWLFIIGVSFVIVGDYVKKRGERRGLMVLFQILMVFMMFTLLSNLTIQLVEVFN